MYAGRRGQRLAAPWDQERRSAQELAGAGCEEEVALTAQSVTAVYRLVSSSE